MCAHYQDRGKWRWSVATTCRGRQHRRGAGAVAHFSWRLRHARVRHFAEQYTIRPDGPGPGLRTPGTDPAPPDDRRSASAHAPPPASRRCRPGVGHFASDGYGRPYRKSAGPHRHRPKGRHHTVRTGAGALRSPVQRLSSARLVRGTMQETTYKMGRSAGDGRPGGDTTRRPSSLPQRTWQGLCAPIVPTHTGAEKIAPQSPAPSMHADSARSSLIRRAEGRDGRRGDLAGQRLTAGASPDIVGDGGSSSRYSLGET